ncbi:hypothetical protein VTL71DRAFT_8632 [Oculimacula yallundae]|uniref:Uncharacterized protein n=1 Tax=Oculimacula yallundae TaxID=86028 RepID=A0ABR4CY59_9HELO
MSDSPAPDLYIGRIPDITSAPNPKIPNTSTWTWYCCNRCRGCSIRWKEQGMTRKHLKSVYDRTMAFAGGRFIRTGYKGKGLEEWDETSRLVREGLESDKMVEREDDSERDSCFPLDSTGGSSSDSGESGSSEEGLDGEVREAGRMIRAIGTGNAATAASNLTCQRRRESMASAVSAEGRDVEAVG